MKQSKNEPAQEPPSSAAEKVVTLPSYPKQKKRATKDKEGIISRFRIWLRDNMLLASRDSTIKEALVEVLEESQQAAEQLPAEEKTLFKNILNFGEISVSDIMVARSGIQAVEYDITLDELTKHVIEQRHTRIPVYQGTLDAVKGFIHIKDLVPVLSGDAVFDMALILRDILFIPPSMKVMDLLVKMRLSRVHIAIVVDEMGGTDGLVTMENLFELIVGEIQDEHDENETSGRLTWSADRTCNLDARTEVRKIEKELGISLYDKEDGNPDDFDTLGGLLFFHAGRVPSKGEKIEYTDGIRFEILDADPRRIKTVRIFAPANT